MNSFKVGFLALASIVAISYMSLKITTNQSGFGDHVTYRTIVRDASGIFPKTSIKVAGITAGRIKDIELQGNTALITFEVLKKIVITQGSKLRIKTVGFLGDKYLEISVNEESKDIVPEYGLIESSGGDGFDAIVKDASEVLKDVKAIVASIKNTMVPQNQTPPLELIIADVRELMKNAKDMTASLNKIVGSNEERIEEMLANFEELSERLNSQFDTANQESVIRDLKDILANTKRMTSDLAELVKDVKSGKGSVGKFLVEDDVADEVKETLSSVKKLVNKVDVIRTELALFTGGNTSYGSHTTGDLRIYPSPERFYQIGVVTSDVGPVKEKETTTVSNGVSSTQIEKVRERDSYRFNVILGRKLHNWSFRGGLIESSGGVGVDYEVPRFKTVFSAEAFDYRKDVGVNFRFGSEIHFWNVFYGKAQGEDLVNNTRSATFTVGLKFLDEDLKGILGFLF